MASGGGQPPLLLGNGARFGVPGCNHHPKAAFADVRPLVGCTSHPKSRYQAPAPKMAAPKGPRYRGSPSWHRVRESLCAPSERSRLRPPFAPQQNKEPSRPSPPRRLHFIVPVVSVPEPISSRDLLFLLSRLRDSHLGLQVLTSLSLSIPEQPFSHSFLLLLPRSPSPSRNTLAPCASATSFATPSADSPHHTKYHIKEKPQNDYFIQRTGSTNLSSDTCSGQRPQTKQNTPYGGFDSLTSNILATTSSLLLFSSCSLLHGQHLSTTPQNNSIPLLRVTNLPARNSKLHRVGRAPPARTGSERTSATSCPVPPTTLSLLLMQLSTAVAHFTVTFSAGSPTLSLLPSS